jgi:hypothetical protein
MSSTISEAEIRLGLENLSAARILGEFSKCSATEENIRFFLGLLLRSNLFFFKYPNTKQERLRDELLSKIGVYIQEHFGVEIQHSFIEIVELIQRVELGYRNILGILRKLPIRTKPAVIQASAALELAAHRLHYIQIRAHESIRKAKTFTFSDEVVATIDDGSEFHVDAAIAGFVENLGTTLTMFAHENSWIRPDGVIQIPAPCECSENEVNEALGTEILATSWRRWERVEQRRRYWGGQFVDLPKGRPLTSMPEALAYFEYVPTQADEYDWVANERFKEYVMQNLAELRYETFAYEKVSGISAGARLLPDEFVNLQELNAASLLSMELGVDVRSDKTLYSGLRVIEWLRGYCTLSEIASLGIQKGATPGERNLIKFCPGELEDKLTSLGLLRDRAIRFIANATLATRSEDLFDCPLLQISDGSLLLFAPAAVHVHPAVVTYSNLVSMDEKFEGKGKRFEEMVIRFFKEEGFEPYSVKTSRDGESFELDVIVPWGEYLFVFECKNRALSNQHPIRSYYFHRERTNFIRQVRRQAKALLDYPDMSIEAGGIDPRSKTIVPCVLYDLPYAEPGSIEGVFIADWSSVSRFFKNRYLRSKIPYALPKRNRLLHRTALYSFWSGERPSPEDLLRQLSDPTQIKIMRSRREPIESVFIVDEESFGVTTEYQRRQLKMAELGRLLGFDHRVVSREERRVRKMVTALNRKFERVQLRDQTRAFREKQKREES